MYYFELVTGKTTVSTVRTYTYLETNTIVSCTGYRMAALPFRSGSSFGDGRHPHLADWCACLVACSKTTYVYWRDGTYMDWLVGHGTFCLSISYPLGLGCSFHTPQSRNQWHWHWHWHINIHGASLIQSTMLIVTGSMWHARTPMLIVSWDIRTKAVNRVRVWTRI